MTYGGGWAVAGGSGSLYQGSGSLRLSVDHRSGKEQWITRSRGAAEGDHSCLCRGWPVDHAEPRSRGAAEPRRVISQADVCGGPVDHAEAAEAAEGDHSCSCRGGPFLHAETRSFRERDQQEFVLDVAAKIHLGRSTQWLFSAFSAAPRETFFSVCTSDRKPRDKVCDVCVAQNLVSGLRVGCSAMSDGFSRAMEDVGWRSGLPVVGRSGELSP
jgi:hypothetical protein